jgi:hypothetical protein
MYGVFLMKVILKENVGEIKYFDKYTAIEWDIFNSFKINDGDLLLFSFYERNLHTVDDETKSFINERKVFTNCEWVLPWVPSFAFWEPPGSGNPPKIIWFRVKNEYEVFKALKIDWLFRCVLVPQNLPFKDHTFVLFLEEGDSYSSLGFIEKQIGIFESSVLPKLNHLEEVELIKY